MKKKYWIITFGCQINKSDSERIAYALEKKGYEPALKEKEADLILVNMCSVRQKAVDRVFGTSQKLIELKTQKPKLKTILTGCVLKSDRKKFKGKFDEIWNSKNYFDKQPKCQNKPLFYIPISNGCDNFCTYCVVPYTRGPLICRGHEEILKEAKKAVEKDYKEIWLLGQNVNDYQSPTDKKINFAKLLKEVSGIAGDFQVKFMSPNPKNFSDELIEVMTDSEKVAKYLNLPVQSGDNEILRKMNRPYTAEQYQNLVKRIRQKIPDISLSTDIIVGFPSETKKQFENTLKLFKQLDCDMAYIAKFSSRPGTPAAKMEDNVSPKEKERRWKILNEIILKKLKEKQEIKNKKLVVILGPTASGKSDLTVKLAKEFKAEVISADSRQIYKGMNVGSGKITEKEMKGIPHHLLDVANPKTRFSVNQYRKLALKAIEKIFKKRKAPILCGGTGFYIQAVTDGIVLPEVKPDWKLRKKLEEKTTEKLFSRLKKLDPSRAKTIDKNNRRRLIRALEIVIKTKKPVPELKIKPLPYPVLFIGIKKDKEELKKRIEKRLLKRIKQGMVEEVKKLRKSGVSWQRLEEFGLEYRFISQYLQKKIKYDEMISNIQRESEQYAKRQMTWFKKDKRIKWVENYSQIKKLVKDFLK